MIESLTEPPPAVGWASGPLGEVQRAQREIARQTAREARALAAFAATRPASADRPAGVPGAMSAARRAARPEVLAEVSEWAAQEVSVALSVSREAAEALLARSLTLVHRLPATLAALEAGAVHVGHLWTLLEKVATVPDAKARARLERDLLAWVRGRSVTTPAQLGAKVRRELLARNLRSMARELEAALRRRGVSRRPDRTEGMAVFEALLTVPEVEALLEALGTHADALVDDPADGPPRTRGQKMADCLLDLVLRPGEHGLPAVRAQLTVVAPVSTMVGGSGRAEIGGEPVPAELVRALAHALGLIPPDQPDPGPEPLNDAAPGRWIDDDEANPEALDRWWAEVESRALTGEWGGEDDPPLEELERWWAEQSRWTAWDDDDGDLPTPTNLDPTPGASSPDPAIAAGVAAAEQPSWWAAADRAVDAASAALLELDRRLSRAQSAVSVARLADAADEEDWQQSSAGRMTRATDAITALHLASTEQRAALAWLLDRTGGGGLVDRPRIAVTDALSGALLALTDAREVRACAAAGSGLGPPPPSPGYRPGAVLDRFMRARDRRCRQPGCRRRVPSGGELDHTVPWPDGPTAAGNLCGFCTPNHRGKHQAPGWHYEQSSDGRLTVTTPTGLTATTDPPPF